MDDIAEIKTPRKVQMKLWQNEKEEKICEIQPVEGGAAPQRYQTPPRRCSEIVQPTAPQVVSKPRRASGIVCSNNDLMSIVSSLTSSAQEINEEKSKPVEPQAGTSKPPSSLDHRRGLLKGSRSNSFDVSLLPEGKEQQGGNWFARRHQPMANKKYLTPRSTSEPQEEEQEPSPPPPVIKAPPTVTFADEIPNVDRKKQSAVEPPEKLKKVVWDKPSGSVIDAQLIGSAIEVYLNKKVGGDTSPTSQSQNQQPAEQEQTENTTGSTSKTAWFGNKTKPADEEEGSCDNSICSTLKDLFVK